MPPQHRQVMFVPAMAAQTLSPWAMVTALARPRPTGPLRPPRPPGRRAAQAAFSRPRLGLKPPQPAAGWRRDFLLKVQGWAKDRDANTLHSQTVEPLPFRSMKEYGEVGPAGDWKSEFNTRPALRLLRPLGESR